MSKFKSVFLKSLPALAVLSMLFAGSCSGKPVENHRGEARDLYRRCATLTRDYTDSLRKAPDTTAALRLAAEYEERMTELNFRYPPDTDTYLTEGENDTLFMLTQRYVRMRDRKVGKIKDPEPPASSDSLNDSIE